MFTADMAVQNAIGDAFRGATWVSLHNGGGVGWGEVINGGFGMLLDGTPEASRRLESMLHWDVNNGVARRAWARNSGADAAIRRAMELDERLNVTLPPTAWMRRCWTDCGGAMHDGAARGLHRRYDALSARGDDGGTPTSQRCGVRERLAIDSRCSGRCRTHCVHRGDGVRHQHWIWRWFEERISPEDLALLRSQPRALTCNRSW